jgi:hypothetical protein
MARQRIRWDDVGEKSANHAGGPTYQELSTWRNDADGIGGSDSSRAFFTGP